MGTIEYREQLGDPVETRDDRYDERLKEQPVRKEDGLFLKAAGLRRSQ